MPSSQVTSCQGWIDVCTVDAEGHDPLVLEGMSAALRDKRVTLLEFEYHSKGFWSPKHRESRTLQQVTAMLDQMGYRCYLEGSPSVYLPLTQGCWRPTFERHKWSNVFCTHHDKVRAIIDAKAWEAFNRRTARRQHLVAGADVRAARVPE
jgi:hypothetical protein